MHKKSQNQKSPFISCWILFNNFVPEMWVSIATALSMIVAIFVYPFAIGINLKEIE